jgi:hypothetical protein
MAAEEGPGIPIRAGDFDSVTPKKHIVGQINPSRHWQQNDRFSDRRNADTGDFL